MTPETAEKILLRAVKELAEHCESVQILASWTEPDGSTGMTQAFVGIPRRENVEELDDTDESSEDAL